MKAGIKNTVIEALVSQLGEQAQRFNPSLESAPVAVLWTDERRDWAGVLPQIQSAMPELFALGPLHLGARTGPGVWLRMVADRQAGNLQPGQVPVIYLPGVGNGSLRTDLRALKDDPQLAPLAELQYRGIFWRQDNSKDWTLRAFFESKRHGLGLAVKGDQETLAALKRALPKLLSRSLVTLEGRAIDLAFLDEILNPNPADDVLRWLADPVGLQKEKGGDWPSFVASSRQRYGIDLGKGALSAAGLVLEARESDLAFQLWEKFVLRPDEQAGLYEVFKAVPKPDLLSGADRYPRENEADEQTLAQALRDLAKVDANAAAAKILELDAQHSPRRHTVWARMDKAPLAAALQPMATVARASLQPVVGGTVAHQAAVWAAEGWQVDAAALRALAMAQTAGREAEVEPALAAVYRPWLQRAAEAFQQRVQTEGYPARAGQDGAAAAECRLEGSLGGDRPRLAAAAGRLPKAELPAKLTETKWGRCAVLKEAAPTTIGWCCLGASTPAVRIALAPGISAFSKWPRIRPRRLELQESVVPFMKVTRDGPVPGKPTWLRSVAWNTRKTICTVVTTMPRARRAHVERLGSAIGEPSFIDSRRQGQTWSSRRWMT
jgi:hypothetical protein